MSWSRPTPRLSVPLPKHRPMTCLGPVERVYATEKVSVAYDPISVYPVVTAYSITARKTRALPALSALAHEDMDRAEAWVLRCGSSLVY